MNIKKYLLLCISKWKLCFHYFRNEYHIFYTKHIQLSINNTTPVEKVVLLILIAIFSLSTFSLALNVRNETTTKVPMYGGVIREGVIGAPRFINPLLAPSDTDRDLVALIYSGLMRPGPDGRLIPDLAKRYSISEDGKVYTFVLKDTITFHDETPVTADDIVFTIKLAQDPTIKSPLHADWEGVVVKKITDREITFTLKHPYAPFLENTTIGILPRHLWLNVSPQEFAFSKFNTQPIGSGPFKLQKINYNSSGIPYLYDLRSFDHFALGRPYINKFIMRFYSNENDLLNAYSSSAITSMSEISSTNLKKYMRNDSTVLQLAFPRIFALFFNQNKNHTLANVSVRKALDILIDKKSIVNEILDGYGTVIDSPIPPHTVHGQYTVLEKHLTKIQRQNSARSLLEKDGWKYITDQKKWSKDDQELSFSIDTANTPELKRAAELSAKAWTDFGIKTKVNVFETGDLNQNIIRPREYEVLLFGEVIGRNLDLFAFWHSSQKDDPGLNIAMYTNTTVDSLLSKARTKSDTKERDNLYVKAENEIRNDIPAVFLYSPDFLYIVPNKMKGINTHLVATPSERFSQVYLWNTQTERIWNFLVQSD